jgi:hypothetical protein
VVYCGRQRREGVAKKTAKLKPVRHAKVRLLLDVRTRGGVRFREGLHMWLSGTEYKYGLYVYVRGRCHHLTLDKKDHPRYFEVVAVPEPEPETEVPRADRAD